ncbi:MAG: hypothetical protein KKC71_07595 [Chloroflexi bacterium]|nr:hypothetical protein [Chloroflexota bacterium]
MKARLFKLWRGLPAQLFLLVVLPFAALALIIAIISLGLHQQVMRSMVAERDVRAVRTAADFLQSRIEAEQQTVNGLASYAAQTPEAAQADLAAYLRLNNLNGKNLALSDPNGVLLVYAGAPELRSVLEGQGQFTEPSGNLVRQTSDGHFVLILWEQAGNVTALGLLPVDDLAHSVLDSTFHPDEQAAAFLVDPGRQTIFHMGKLDWSGEPGTHPGVAEALRGESGSTYVQAQTSEHVVAYSPVAPVGWALIIEEPWQAVDTPWLRATQFAPFTLLPVLLLALVALWFGISQIVTPLQKLEAQAVELSWGDFQAIERPAGGIPEIRQLQTELIHLARKVQASQQRLHDYIGAITAGQEEERRRLARELHDETLQSLIALRQRVQLARLKSKDDETCAAFADLERMSSETVDELRRLARALRPVYLEDLGLVTALEMLARETGTGPELTVRFERKGVERRLDPALELALYRIVQEALSNVTRHAGASQASVCVIFQADEVVVEITDNGRGFTPLRSPADFAGEGHYGLLGMHERAELVGAKITIVSAPGAGTTITVRV